MELKYRILIGIVVLVVISGIVSSFSGGGGDEQEKLDTDRGNDSAAADATAESSAPAPASSTSSTSDTSSQEEIEAQNRVAAVAKFKAEVVDPSKDPEIIKLTSNLLMKKFDLNADGKITADEIPDGDLKTELMGYDVDEDGILNVDEFSEYVKNRN
mgnify:CR=1 FL=1|tara:strand:- start:1372 stop:1842 length:471 start_codon:yes stop_codon:yes gene_type:complete